MQKAKNRYFEQVLIEVHGVECESGGGDDESNLVHPVNWVK